MFEKYAYLVDNVLRKMAVPKYIEDDCRQAGYVGLLRALDSLKHAESPESYIFIAVKNEILKELARMHGVGHLPISMKANTFLAYGKYKSGANIKVSPRKQAAFDKIRKAIPMNVHTRLPGDKSRGTPES